MKNKVFALSIVLALIFTCSCAAQKSASKNNPAIGGVESSIFETGEIKNIKITDNKANVNAGCSSNSPVLQTSSKDSKLNVISKVEDWYAVKLPTNQIGFVSSGQCKPIVVEDKKANIPPETSTTPQGTTAPKTPTTKANSTKLTDAEQQMLNLVNEARAQNNLPALKADMALTNVARVKSQDMIDNNYFSHNSPKYGSPFDMMKSFGINYVQAGENIAGNQNVQNAENALMNSPGHRKNILSPDFTHIGIGIKAGGPYGNMFTQMFISKPQ